METSTEKKRNRLVRRQMDEVVIEGYKNGATLNELAKVHGCSPSTISNILNDHKVQARRRGPKKENDNGNVKQAL
jgi:intein-encoded DNA endonuclease-like protein